MAEPKHPYWPEVKPTYHWQSAEQAWGHLKTEPPTELAKAVKRLELSKREASK